MVRSTRGPHDPRGRGALGAGAARDFIALLAVALLTGACHGEDLRDRIAAAGVFSPVRIDVGNPELVTLGQALFFDPELSGNRNIACATCHLPERHSADGRRIAIGQAHGRLTRTSPALFNLGDAEAFFWDGRLEKTALGITGPVALPTGLASLLEAQVLLPLLDRHEMRGDRGNGSDGRPNELGALPDDATDTVWQSVMNRLLALPGYRALFAAAYPDVAEGDLSIVHVARAVVSFETRLWELNDTGFDTWLGSVSAAPDKNAMNEFAVRGADLFFGDAGCSRCHNGPLLSDGKFHAIGVPQIGPGRDARHADLGRYEVTLDEQDRFKFRTPPLRSVALTAPYMHDGAYDSLEVAVRHHVAPEVLLRNYDSSRLPADLRAEVHHELDDELVAAIDPELRPRRVLSDEDIMNLVEFLNALSSSTEMFLPPDPAVPATLPSGLPLVLPDTNDLGFETPDGR